MRFHMFVELCRANSRLLREDVEGCHVSPEQLAEKLRWRRLHIVERERAPCNRNAHPCRSALGDRHCRKRAPGGKPPFWNSGSTLTLTLITLTARTIPERTAL
nr:hypothetical protein [Tanacetum cinerariifolium]